MKLLSREQIESLVKHKSADFLTTSFFINTDKARMMKKEVSLSFKNLLNEGKSQLNRMNVSKKKKESLTEDLEKIRKFGKQHLSSYNYPGLALFSCSGEEFWQVFYLPDSPSNKIVFDQNSYVRPLSAILGQQENICILVVDRKEAKWYEVFLGEISLIESLVGDVPSQVKEGGWEGYESKRIERHIATHFHDYLKTIAQKTFGLFKKFHFDWLLLGSKEEYFPDLESLLHPYIKQRLKGRLKVNPGTPSPAILKEGLELIQQIKEQEEKAVLQRFSAELEKNGMAVSGLTDSLRKLNRSEVQLLLITKNFSTPGRVCPRCWFLYVDEVRCPSCQVKTNIVTDIIDEAVEAALEKNSEVRHINAPSPLDKFGNIGAILRFKTP